eukprot:UN01570
MVTSHDKHVIPLFQPRLFTPHQYSQYSSTPPMNCYANDSLRSVSVNPPIGVHRHRYHPYQLRMSIDNTNNIINYTNNYSPSRSLNANSLIGTVITINGQF